MKNIVTILLHDYFHRAIFKQYIGEKQWHRFESRLDKNIDDTLELLSAYNAKATFFTLGWIAEKNQEIIKRIARESHEISSAGYWARSITEITKEQIVEDLKRSKKALEDAGANRIIGFRSAYKWLNSSELGVLDVLAELGYRYDASYRPAWLKSNDKEQRKFVFSHECDWGEIVEFPVSTISLIGFNIPISGGSYMRHFPHRLVFAAFKRWIRTIEAPFVLYFHPWELDVDQPVISAINKMDYLRQYRNLGKLKQILPFYLGEAEFTSISDYLHFELEYPYQDAPLEKSTIQYQPTTLSSILGKTKNIFESSEYHAKDHAKNDAIGVTIAIPCYNESSSISYLDKSLVELIVQGGEKYDFYFVFVDDFSNDDTYTLLQEHFGDNNKCMIVQHAKNRGVAAALLTGIQSAPTEIVCTMDADCSYDPIELLKMIPLLEKGVDMVTASPYHREGFVMGVPQWRLFLSKKLSKIYHYILENKLATYTSCFRVCRKMTILKYAPTYEDFRGILEIVALLDLNGGRIVEYPSTLHSRIFGQSKMKVISTIFGHIKLVLFILRIKLMRYWYKISGYSRIMMLIRSIKKSVSKLRK